MKPPFKMKPLHRVSLILIVVHLLLVADLVLVVRRRYRFTFDLQAR